jgi:Tfp pilus assembly protein PilF
MKRSLPSYLPRILFPLLVGVWSSPISALCQDSSGEGTMSRGTRTELAVTVYDRSGHIITSSATIRLYKDGITIDQQSTTNGQVFFIARAQGDFSVAVEAAGYKSVQKEVSTTPSTKNDVPIYLQRILAANESAVPPGEPLLAPKAKEALVKALQALEKNKLDEAQKHLTEVLKLAPSNPEVLYVQGLLDLKRSDWSDAETVLEKSDQLEPNQARVLAGLGLALCNQKKYDQAIPPLEKSIQLNSAATLETKWTLAKSYYYREQYEEALKMAQEARSETNRSSPQLDLLLAQCLTAMGRYEDSAQLLRDILKNYANSSDAATARRWLDGLVANGKVHPTSTP